RDRVTDLVDLLAAPIPMLEMLDHGVLPPAARRDTGRVAVPEAAAAIGWTAHDIIESTGPAPGATYIESVELSAQLVRTWRTRCESEMAFAQVFSHMLAVAEIVNPNLHPQPAGALWR